VDVDLWRTVRRMFGGAERSAVAAPLLLPSWNQPQIPRTLAQEQDEGIYPLQVYAKTRWDPVERDTALRQGDAGDYEPIAKMLDAMRSDGLISGIMDTLCDGLIRLPPKWSGDAFLIDRLRGRDPLYGTDGLLERPGIGSDYWRMFPSEETAAVIWDGVMGGLGIGELVPQADGGPPILQHLDLHWVRYRWTTDSYHYLTATGGDYEITPGDGRWVFYAPYGRRRPWARGKWWSTAIPFIQKQNAAFDRLRWHANLADALKVIEAQAGADEKHRAGLIHFVKYLWKRAAGLVTPMNYKASLVESNGQGYQVYKQGEERADIEIQVSLSGQLVSATGTNGLGGKADMWDTIRTDRVHKYADSWANTAMRDGIVPYTARVLLGGTRPDDIEKARARAPSYQLDARSPQQRAAEAQALKQFSEAVASAAAMLEKVEPENEVDLAALLEEQGLTLPRRRRAVRAPQAPPVSSEEA
jgi:hypothetical protein